MTKVAVVILNWNGQKLLERFLPSVIESTSLSNVEIIVADNASTDSSIAFLQSRYPDIKQIILPQNYGFAKGYNDALKQIDAEYFVLLNSDVEVTENWLSPMVEYLDKNKDVAAAQPKILSERAKEYFEYAGAAGGYIDRLGFPFCRGRLFDTIEKDTGQYDEIEDVFWASGACMLIRSEDYFVAGGLDEKFFAHMEEIDLCWRLKSRGRRVVCIPKSIVYHVGGATLGQETAHKVYLNFRNNMLMLYKNLDDKTVNKIIHKRLIYNNIAALKYLLSGHIEKMKAVFKAHKDFKKLRSSYQVSRQKNIVNRVGDIQGIYSGSIIKDYYLLGKKHFSDLEL